MFLMTFLPVISQAYINQWGVGVNRQSSRSGKGGNKLHLYNTFKGACFPHSWEDINSEINCSQMLYSARIYQ